MTQRGLSKEEIRKRLIRLRNVEYLHEQQRFKIWNLRDENRQFRKEIVALKATVKEQQKTIDDLKLQIEELKTIVFGKKKQSEKDDDDVTPPKEKVPRTNDSYRRPIPKEEEVTEIKHHTLSACSCGEFLVKKKAVIFYEEDIPIPTKKIVRKHIVEKAYCAKCQRWKTAVPLPNHKAVTGSNVQKYICYLSVLCRSPYSQIQNVLKDTYDLDVSQGEIAKILNREANTLRPEYERLKARIRGEPGIHLDEIGWKLFMGEDTSYSWVMSGTESKESVFLVGESRGKGNIETLTGGNFSGFAVTDDYGAYKHLNHHQLCWAHLIRKFRDIAYSKELPERERDHCKEEYRLVSQIYADVKENKTMERYDEFAKRLTNLSVIHCRDPKKLIRIKTTLKKNIPLYLTCLTDARIPLTNNQAERSLRHLVLKRKISFGSFTKRTAENLSILMSVLLSLRQRNPLNFFQSYMRV